MSILVTLCNLPQPGSGLLVVDYPRDATRLIDIGAGGRCVGCTGMSVCDSQLYCAWIGPEQGSFVSILDRSTLTVLECTPLNDVKDVHSICAVDGWLYLVSTGTDEVRRVRTGGVGSASELVWRASSAGCDTHHINSILALDGRLLCSAFGPKITERWSTAVEGYIVDIGSNESLYRDIEHPHSLAASQEDLYVAESRRARVRGLRTGRTVPVEGYARGLAFCRDGRVVTGSSRGRARSRSLGTIENPADPGEPEGRTGLIFLSAFGETEGRNAPNVHVDLSEHGPEIYDIVVL
jgi:hypothetical protein